MTTAEAIDRAPEVLDLEERNWLPRHCRGDASAFGKLVCAYRTLVFTFLHRYGVSPQERDDLFQDIFFKIHLAAASYRPSQPLRPWIVTIVLNTVRNSRRHFHVHPMAHEGAFVLEFSNENLHPEGLCVSLAALE